VFRSSERRRNLREKGVEFGKQSGFRGVLVVASKRANEGFIKRLSVGRTVALEACSCVEASERKRGGLHVESAIGSCEEVILP